MPSIVAVILNYVKRGDARGTWARVALPLADPHVLVRGAVGHRRVLLIVTLVGAIFGFVVLVALTIWLLYRIARGWLRLRDTQPMYV